MLIRFISRRRAIVKRIAVRETNGVFETHQGISR
jgi:hypothetical protein